MDISNCCSSGRVRIFLFLPYQRASSSVNFRVGPSITVSCSYTMSSNLRRNSHAYVNPVLVFYFQHLVSKALRSVHGLCMLFPLNFSVTDNFRRQVCLTRQAKCHHDLFPCYFTETFFTKFFVCIMIYVQVRKCFDHKSNMGNCHPYAGSVYLIFHQCLFTPTPFLG